MSRRYIISWSLAATWFALCAVLFAAPPGESLPAQPTMAPAPIASLANLSDAQRIALLQDLDARYGLPYVEPGNPLDRQIVEGAVRTHDGTPLPGDLELCIAVQRTRSEGLSSGCQFVPNVKVKHGNFRQELRFGVVSLLAQSADYAPLLAGPFLAIPGGNIGHLELVFDPGFTATIKVIDPSGKPVPNTRLAWGRYLNGVREFPVIARPVTGDGAGVITIPHCRDWPAEIMVHADGYQNSHGSEPYAYGYKCHLSAEKAVVITLRPARATTGRAVSAATHLPVVGAKVKQFSYRTAAGGGWDGSATNTLAVTGTNGQFALTSLDDGATYGFIVEAPDGTRVILRDIKAGQSNITAELAAAVVHGKVTGHLERIVVDGKPTIFYAVQDYDTSSMTFTGIAPPFGYSGYRYDPWIPLPVEFRDGAGYFNIGGLHRGLLRLNVAGANTWYSLVDRDLNVEIQVPVGSLGHRPEVEIGLRRVFRSVVATLQVPRGAPVATGFVRFQPLWDCSVTDAWGHSSRCYAPVVQGSARWSFPIPNNDVDILPGDLIGYTFGKVRVDLRPCSAILFADGPAPPLDQEILSRIPGANYGNKQAEGLSEVLVLPTMERSAMLDEWYPYPPRSVDIELRPGGAIFGNMPSDTGDVFEVAAVPVGIPAGEEIYQQIPGIVNPVRHTYIIHALPLGVHYKVMLRGYGYGSEFRSVMIADDVSIDAAHVAARADLTKMPQP